MNIKYLTLPLISATLVFTGCASRKPAAEITAGNTPNGSTTVSTEGLSEDAALNAQNLAGASSKGVTAANKAFLAKRVVHFDYDSSDLSNENGIYYEYNDKNIFNNYFFKENNFF